MAVETFAYGITREWLDEGTLGLITTQGDMRRAAIDVWVDVVQSTLDTLKEREVIVVMHDLSHPAQGFTNYARQRALDILNRIPKDKPVYTALILQNKLETQLIKIFLGTLGRLLGKHQIRVFTERDKGLAWLRANQAKHAQPQATK